MGCMLYAPIVLVVGFENRSVRVLVTLAGLGTGEVGE